MCCIYSYYYTFHVLFLAITRECTTILEGRHYKVVFVLIAHHSYIYTLVCEAGIHL